MPTPRRLRVALLAACVLLPSLAVTAGSASAATVALNGRTFNAACTAANAGDVVTVPAGSYGSQSISCTKSVTLLAQGDVTLSSLSFSGANGPTVDGLHVTGSYASGAVSVMKSQNVTIRDTTINNMTYVEGSVDVLFDHDTWEPLDSSTKWNNGDMVDIYEQARDSQPNTRITIQDSTLHGLRAPTSTSHSDAIQFCNCAGNDIQHSLGIKIQRTKFYDNECMNVRANPNTDITLENNVFGDTMSGISGCGYYALDVFYAQANVRYNTFPGNQEVQVSTSASANYGQSQSWVGNVGAGMSSSCGAIRGTYAYNVWTEQKCSSTDKQVSSLKLNSDGSPQTGSPVIGAGNPSSFPANDFTGAARTGTPDAGAFEFGGTTVPTPPTPPADTTAPNTTINSAPVDGSATTASVTFTADESGATFQCRLDGAAWAACVSPKSFSGLAAGKHSIDVRATDAAGNTDASPATASWTIATPPPVDTTAPVTAITVAPSNGTATTASVTFTSNESGSTFQCSLDGGTWTACTSPATFDQLAVGNHTISVRAIDAAGNVDASPATASWTVAAPAPPVVVTPDPPVVTPPTTPVPPVVTPDPAAGLVAAYGFNETSGTTVKDSSGHGLNGTRSGATSTGYGKFGRALSFDGDRDMVTIADNARLDLTNGMTLEAWVNPSTVSGWRTIIAKEQSNNLVYGLYGSGDGGRLTADVFRDGEQILKGPSALPTGKWSHVATTFNGSTLTLLLNGVAVATKAVSGPIAVSNGALRIGGTAVWGEWFKGKVDEVRVYDKALSATQVKADMNKAI